MSKGKKLTVLLAVLMALLAVVAGIDKEISGFEYAMLWINVIGLCGLNYTSEGLIEAQGDLLCAQDDLICALKLSAKALEDMNDRQRKKLGRLMDTRGFTVALEKVDALPKVVSATGEVYVDYEEVMKVLRGDEIVER